MPARIRGLLERFLGKRPTEAINSAPADGELLRRFASTNDAEAFELLVWRHGSMVLGLCRRKIRDKHLAEDAFQAVFMVLARNARSIRGENIAGWLYRVACRVATQAAHTRDRLRPLPEVGIQPATHEVEREELSQVLDSEIARLPERLRQPVLLCYLGGRSTEEAALTLNCPRGTVLSRLSTARQQLAARLNRRGISLPAMVIVAGWESSGELVSATVAASLRFVAVRSPVDPAAVLAQGVIRNMTYNKTMMAIGVVVAIGLAGGVGWSAASGDRAENGQTAKPPITQAVKLGHIPGQGGPGEFVRAANVTPAEQTPDAQLVESLTDEVQQLLKEAKLDPAPAIAIKSFLSDAIKPHAGDNSLRQLQRERCGARALYIAKITSLMNIGKWNPQDFADAIKVPVDFTKNLLELAEKPEDKLKCYEFQASYLHMMFMFSDTRVMVGSDPTHNRDYAKAAWLDAEIDLLRFKDAIAKGRK